MPCTQCKNGKWKIGRGRCVYETKEKCQEAERAMYAEQDGKAKKGKREKGGPI